MAETWGDGEKSAERLNAAISQGSPDGGVTVHRDGTDWYCNVSNCANS